MAQNNLILNYTYCFGEHNNILYNHSKTCLRKCVLTPVSVLQSSRTVVPIMGVGILQRGHKITLRGHEVINDGWERIKKQISITQNDADIF